MPAITPRQLSDPVVRCVLIIAYYFPPIGGIGSIRLAAFAAHLREFGWEPTVIAPRSTPHALDPSIRFSEDDVVRARSLEPSLLLRSFRAGRGRRAVTTSQPGKHAAPTRLPGLRAALPRVLFFPDAQAGWYPGALRAGLHSVRDRPFDAVLSSAFPVTAHLVAWSVSRRARLPWIAEFRDPWSDTLPRYIHRPAADRLERTIARHASRIVVPSAALADHFARRWGVEVHAIPNGCDLTLGAGLARPDPPVIAHVGTYYPGRQSLLTVWRALAELRLAGKPPPRIRWVGELPRDGRAEIAAYGLTDVLEVTGFLPKAEAGRMLRSSTMLIASGEVDTGPLGRGTTAAKLFDYLASDVPILFVGDLRSDAALMLQKHAGCHVVAFGDVTRACQALESGLRGKRYDRDVDVLSRRARTADLAALLSSAVSRS